MFAGVGAGRKLAGHGGFHQQVGIGDQGLQMRAHLFDGVVDEGFLAGKLLQRRFKVTAAELGDAGHGFFLDADVAAHHFIDPGGHGAIRAFKVVRRNDGVNVSRVVRLGHADHVGNELLQVGAQLLNVFVDEGLLAGKFLQWRIKISAAELGDAGHGFFLNADVAAYHLVNTGGDLLVNAVELAGIDHYIDVAQIMLVRHVADLFHQAGQRSDALVQVLLNDIEVTMVGVADLRRQIALANTIHVFAGDRQWTNHRIQRPVNPLHHLSILAAMLGGVSASRELAFDSCLGQRLDVSYQGRDAPHHRNERRDQLIAIGATRHLLQRAEFLGELATGYHLKDPDGVLNSRLDRVCAATQLSECSRIVFRSGLREIVDRHSLQDGVDLVQRADDGIQHSIDVLRVE